MSDIPKSRPVIALVWDNFGPLHDDRVAATAAGLKDRADVVGIEISARSTVYSWEGDPSPSFRKITLFPDTGDSARISPAESAVFYSIFSSLRHFGATHVFVSHYQRIGIAALAYALRASGREVFVMNDSKLDDFPRLAVREALKLPFLWPYNGGIVGSEKTREFLGFLGRRSMPMELGCNSVSVKRLQGLACGPTYASLAAVHDSIGFEDRDFVILARLVPKKNLFTAIAAFAEYRHENAHSTRKLQICGDGPLEADLIAHAAQLGLQNEVMFHGFLQSPEIVPILVRAAALVLVSREEQFGCVVLEALALGIPVILSDACGARYEFLRSGVNGYLVEPDNVAGIAGAMERIVSSPLLWEKMHGAALAMAPLGDVARFVRGVESLVFGRV